MTPQVLSGLLRGAVARLGGATPAAASAATVCSRGNVALLSTSPAVASLSSGGGYGVDHSKVSEKNYEPFPEPETSTEVEAAKEKFEQVDSRISGVQGVGDSVVVERDYEGNIIGRTGPDHSVTGGRYTVFQDQRVEDEMHTGKLPRQTDEEVAAMNASRPAGDGDIGTPERLMPEASEERMTSKGGMRRPLGEHVAERTKQVVGGMWETLKHGVNNAGQPQVQDELKKS